MKKVILFLIISSACLYAQIPLKNNFLISGPDNSPSTFIQESPELFHSNNSGFLTTWTDYRRGEPAVYAQRFDNHGNKINIEFFLGIKGEEVSTNNENSLLTLRQVPSGAGDVLPGELNVEYNLYDLFNMDVLKNNLLNLYIENYNESIKGDAELASSSEAFYYLANFGGTVSLLKFSFSDEVKMLHELNNLSQFNVYGIASAATNKGNYFFACIKSSDDAPETGLYATFINPSDSVIVSDLFISGLDLPADFRENQYSLKALALNDSTYRLSWLNNETLKLYSATIDVKGEIYNTDSLSLSDNREVNSVKFVITNNTDNGFFTYISFSQAPSSFMNLLIKYDKDGKREGDVISEELETSIFKSNTFYDGEKLFSVSSDGKDVFLNESDKFTLLNQRKINGDESGSNELNGSLLTYSSNSTFALWRNEESFYGIKISPEGELISDRIKLPGMQGIFTKDNELVLSWSKKTEDALFSTGVSIYNNNFDLINEVELTQSSSGNLLNSMVVAESDNLVIGYATTNTILKLVVMDKEGSLIKEKNIAQPLDYNYKIKVFAAENSSIWVNWGDSLQKYNYNLEPESPVKKGFSSAEYYLGNNRFLCLVKKSFDFIDHTFFNIKDSEGNIIASDISIGIYVDEMKIKSVGADKILIVYKSYGEYYGKVFSNSGSLIKDRFTIFTSTGKIKNPDFAVNNGKIFFTWSDSRNESKGYDVYGSIYDLSSITDVKQVISEIPETYSLSQNYPNPFNPSTRIRFSVPEYSHVFIRIYDILGNEVSTIVNEEKNSGVYETEFNASNLASGIYYYKISAGNYTETRKMLLLK